MTRFVIARDEAEALRNSDMRCYYEERAHAERWLQVRSDLTLSIWEVQISAKRVDTKESHGKS